MKRLLTLLTLAMILPAPAMARKSDKEARTWLVDLQFGSYKPRIDTQFSRGENSTTPPYEEAFGTGREMLFSIGTERIIWSGIGTVSLGLSAGYWNVEGQAVQADGSADDEAGDSTELVIYPLQVQASYRVDTWSEIVPLVPVARAGFSHYFWRILDGSGDVAQFSQGQEASGATQGWHATFGVHLLLDFLDTEMADDFANDAGVENSYLTIEYRYSRVDDFGSADSFRLGDETLLIGLSLDL